MTWNYRILAYEESLALHEVFYDAKGNPDSWTEGPIEFACCADEGVEGITASLEMALADARRYPVLEIVGGKLIAVPEGDAP